MAIDVATKDCNALSEDEIQEMSDLATDGSAPHDTEWLTESIGEWVLAVHARDGKRLVGYALFTLERVGGTPAILVGGLVTRNNAKRGTVMRAVVHEQMRRAVLAFPDEDVLYGACVGGPGGVEAFALFDGAVPRPDYAASGEDRAWGQRLQRRLGPRGDYLKREFRVKGKGVANGVIDHEASKKVQAAVATDFEAVDPGNGDCKVMFSWVLSELLEKQL